MDIRSLQRPLKDAYREAPASSRRNVRALSGLPRKKKCGGAQIVWSGQFR
jgi:hypothetical protein